MNDNKEKRKRERENKREKAINILVLLNILAIGLVVANIIAIMIQTDIELKHFLGVFV